MLHCIDELDVCPICSLNDQWQKLLVKIVHLVLCWVGQGRRLHDLESVMQ